MITGLGVAGMRPSAPERRPVAGPGGFRVAEARTEAAAPLLGVSMPSLLGLQEAQNDSVRDRDARRHAEDTLDELRDLQRRLLGGAAADGAVLERLSRPGPEAANPQLRSVQRALALRVAVEAARARVASSS